MKGPTLPVARPGPPITPPAFPYIARLVWATPYSNDQGHRGLLIGLLRLHLPLESEKF